MPGDIMTSRFLVLDMFAGAGGLSEGFFRHNFDFIGHFEMNNYAAKTLETRSLYHALSKHNKKKIYYKYYNEEISREDFLGHCNDLGIIENNIYNTEISSDNEKTLINGVQGKLSEFDEKRVNVIIGGPPCQAYSYVGRGRDPLSMKMDPRNLLYLHYLEFLKAFNPDIFVFENVPGISTARNGEVYSDLTKTFKKLGYFIKAEIPILNAANFNVLQERRRVIIIGWKKEYNLKYPDFPSKSQHKYKVWDLLNDLHPLQPGEGVDSPQSYRKGRPSDYLLDNNIRNSENKSIRHHSARMHNDLDRDIYKIAIKKWSQNRERLKYPDLPKELKTHSNQTSFLDRFKVVDGWGLSHAVLSHLSKDGHYFIHPDINQARSITVREAARIQSFPDNYLFEGSRMSKYVQIGNAVPPLMADSIANQIELMLNQVGC